MAHKTNPTGKVPATRGCRSGFQRKEKKASDPNKDLDADRLVNMLKFSKKLSENAH